MDLLKAINQVLPKLGEHPVTSVTTKHPTVSIIVSTIENDIKELLLDGWWFNEFDCTLYPDDEGYIAVGSDVLSFVPTYDTAALRGLKLYNTETLSYTFTSPIQGHVWQYIPFEELPESAAQYVYWKALITALATDIGLTQEVQLWNVNMQNAYSRLVSEHLRHKKFSTRKTRQYRKMRAAMNA